ncbi:UDP-N-acetylmuramate dehydrogenase [Bdellovibrionota bacterium FG-2]
MSEKTAAAKAWINDREKDFKGQIIFDEPLSRHTYYRIGGPAKIFVVPRSLEDLQILAELLSAQSIPYFLLGAGSNVLAPDEGFDGLIIRTHKMNKEISVHKSEDGLRLRTGASLQLFGLLRRASKEGWGGLEFLAGIPGSVGGAVFMNAGTNLGEAKDILRRIELFSLTNPSEHLLSIQTKSTDFAYRRNLLIQPGNLLWAAEWEISKRDPAEVSRGIESILERRKSSQPLNFPSCGSVFKNPKTADGATLLAWQLIEKLGLRGHTIGKAQFAEKHCNFVINLGGATAADVVALIGLAKARALKELGVTLEEEVIKIG